MLRYLLYIACLLSTVSMARADEVGRLVLAVGDVQVAGQHLSLGAAVSEGDILVTGSDGYAYLKTIDEGFLILRPNTRVRVVAYQIDRQDASNSHFKFELLGGVARSISGHSVKKARQNFRFNTPVAAIGVRGTDFTVFTDPQSTRIVVLSGGVVVSGFSGACGPEGGGPCEGSSSRELFASQVGDVLQINLGNVTPQLLRGNGLSPDAIAPPRNDEPSGSAASANKNNPVLAVNSVNLDPQKGVQPLVIAPVFQAAPVIPKRQIVWGRFRSIVNQPANIDIPALFDAKAQLLAINSHFAVLRTSGADWQMPRQGSMGFALAQSEAYILNKANGAYSPASVANGMLQLDFSKSTFATSFDLVSQQNERFKLQAQGVVTSDGRMLGNPFYKSPTNMSVRGAASLDGSAAYIFQHRIDSNRTASGVTAWAKK